MLKLFIFYLIGMAVAVAFSAIVAVAAKVKNEKLTRGELIMLFLFNPLTSFLSTIPFVLWMLFLYSPKAKEWLNT